MKGLRATDKEILRLALPSIVSNITVPLLGLVDVSIVGHIGDARYIGAIAVGSMIFNVLYWLFGFLRMGTSGLTAQAYGAQNREETTRMLHRGLTVALLTAAAILLLQLPLRHVAFFLMQATPDVVQLCTPYYNICVWGAPAVLGLYALTGWYIGMQNTRIPMLIAIGQNVVNILASLVLVFGLGLQIEGVALGTVIAQWAGFLTSLWLLHRNYGLSVRFCFSRMSAFLRVNRDIFLRTVCLVCVNLWFTSAGAAQGAVILAVNTLLMQLYLLFSYVLDGFAYAGEALSGRYYGAGDRQALDSVVKRLFGWGGAVTLLFTLTYVAGGSAFLGLLTSDAQVVSAAVPYMPWAWFVPVAGMAAFVWDGIFIGLTLSRDMLRSCFVASVAFFALYFALHPALGNHALWLALLVYLALRGLVQTWLYRH